MSTGLQSVIYFVPDLTLAKTWYSAAFEVLPYFDEPFYVGFRVGASELGLDPDPAAGNPGPGGSVAYWGVSTSKRPWPGSPRSGRRSSSRSATSAAGSSSPSWPTRSATRSG